MNTMLKEKIVESVSEVMKKATERINQNEIEGISEKETSKGNVAVVKRYNLATNIGNRATLTLTDPDLIKSVEKIKFAESGRKVLGYVICKELARIDDSGKLKELGFKSISQFAEAMFGYKESTANHYVRIGKAFITDDYKVKDGLPEYSISHFIELNSLVTDNPDGTPNTERIENLFLEGVIKDGMSTKQLRDAIKSENNKKVVDSTAQEVSEQAEQTEAQAGQAEAQGTVFQGTENKPRVSGETTTAFDKLTVGARALDALNVYLEQIAILKLNGFSMPDVSRTMALLRDVIKKAVESDPQAEAQEKPQAEAQAEAQAGQAEA